MHHAIDENGTLTFRGALTMRHVAETYQVLCTAMANHARLLIDCQAADDIDLTFVQMLVAARNSARSGNKTVRLAAPPAGVLLDRLTRCGFRITGDEPGYWFEEVDG